MTCHSMEYGEVGGVDADFDYFLTTYRHLLTLGLFDILVAVVADPIKTTTPLEVEAVYVAVFPMAAYCQSLSPVAFFSAMVARLCASATWASATALVLAT